MLFAFTVTGSARRPTVYHRWLMVLTKPAKSGKSRFWTPHILRRALDTSLGVKTGFFSDFRILYNFLILILVGTRSPDLTPEGSGPGLRARPPPGPPGPGPGRGPGGAPGGVPGPCPGPWPRGVGPGSKNRQNPEILLIKGFLRSEMAKTIGV